MSPKFKLKQSEAEVVRLRQALERYGKHFPACASLQFDFVGEEDETMTSGPCDCGLSAALRPVEGADTR